MRVCAIELKGNDAIICVMHLEHGLFDIPQVRVPKISVDNVADAEDMRKFQFTIKKFLEDYKIDHVVIKGRAMKGKFAGSAIGFKLEAAIQLIEGVKVEIMASNTIVEILKKSEIHIDFRDTGLKKFQQTAFETAFAFLSKR